MPSLFTVSGYKVFFWSDEGNEPVHVHICKKAGDRKNSTKFWLTRRGGVILAYNGARLSEKDLHKFEEFLQAQYFIICSKWKQYFLLDELNFYC